jgi:MFS family permease
VRVASPYRGVLAVRDARSLIGASAASQLGDWLYNAALLGYVYSATGSAAWVGAATVARLLPYVLLGPVGGAVADRYPLRTVLLAGDLLRTLLMVALAAVVALDGPVALVIALTMLASVAGCAEKPAALAFLPRLVGESRLGAANALLHTVQDLGTVLGPAIGALLLAVGPDFVAFLANGATFAVSALLISTIGLSGGSAAVPAGAIAHIAHGMRMALATPFAIPLFLVVAMVELTYGAQTVQLVVYAEQALDLGSGGYGLLLTALGVGGLLSATVNARLATSRRVALAIVATGAVACATQLVYAGTDLAAIALAVTVIGGAGLVACEVVAETTLARIVPSEALGRVMGVFDAFSVLAMVAGALLAPVLIDWASLDASLLILGGAAVLVTLACLLALRGLDAVSARRAEAVASRMAVIRGLPVTEGAPQLVLERLASAAQTCPLPPGVDVLVQGAPAHAFYAVVDGRVVVHRDGSKVVHLGAGDSFGERGLLDNAPRNATVTTETDTTILRVEGEALLEALQVAPTLRPALDLSSTSPGLELGDEGRPLVDDRDWVGA